MTAQDIITNALIEIGAWAPGETVDSDTAAFCLTKLNRIFDNWNAEESYIYATTLFQGTLTPNKNPHTLGTSANTPDFTVSTVRPPKITEANLVLTDQTPNIYRPLQIVDDAWWMNNPVPSLGTQIPFYLYPNYSWPNAQIFLWPVPTIAYDIRLLIETALGSLALSDTFTMPPGYEEAVTLTLAENLIPNFSNTESLASAPLIKQAAAKARERIRSVNEQPPTMVCDQGVQSMDSRPTLSIANFDSGFFN